MDDSAKTESGYLHFWELPITETEALFKLGTDPVTLLDPGVKVDLKMFGQPGSRYLCVCFKRQSDLFKFQARCYRHLALLAVLRLKKHNLL